MAKTPEMQAAVDSMARALFGRDSSDTTVCVTCGHPSGEFRDDLSWKEFTISGMCQACQDSVFGAWLKCGCGQKKKFPNGHLGRTYTCPRCERLNEELERRP